MSFFTELGQAWNNNVFGSPVIGAIFIMFTFILYGSANRWPIEAIILISVPLMATLSFFILPLWAFALVLIVMATVSFLAVKKLFNL